MSVGAIGLEPSVFELLPALAARSALLLVLGWLGTALLKRAAPPARQALWASVIAGVLILPVLAAVLPAWRVLPALPWQPLETSSDRTAEPALPPGVPQPIVAGGVEVGRARQAGRTLQGETENGSVFPDWRRNAVLLWGAGIPVAASFFLLGLIRLRGIRRGAKPAGAAARDQAARLARQLGVRRRVRVFTASGLSSPATWGLLRPVIVLPAAAERWSAERRLLVLAHELAHIARHDFAWRLLAQIGCIAYWFNPLVWLAARRLRLEQELACDLAVLARGTRPSTYAYHLLSIARAAAGRPLPLVALDMARRSQMEGRLMSILTNRPHRKMRRALLLPALSVLATLPVLAAASTRPAPAPPSEPAPPTAPAVAAVPVAEAAPAAVAAPAPAPVPAAAPAIHPLPVLAESAVPVPAFAPSPVLAPRAAPRPAMAPRAPAADIAGVLAVQPVEPRFSPAPELDAESLEIDEEIARRATEIAELMAPIHEEISRTLDEQMQPILERMELVQREMRPIQEEMQRIGREMSEVVEGELETQVEALERHRASADEIRARLEPQRAQMEALRERMRPERERMEQLRSELEPFRQQLEATREARMAEIQERLEVLRQELEVLRRERDATRSGEDSR